MLCSMIWVTLFSMVCAEAPGYLVVIRTDGGATSGYWEMGSLRTEIAPASMMTMAITQAKMGRSIKNLAMTYSAFFAGVCPVGAACVWAPDCWAATFTGAPGLIFCRPATMTCSPAFNPFVIMIWSPIFWPV